MKALKVYPSNINMRFIAEAVNALKNGEVIAYPTDTFYALGCDALNNNAIEKICRIKDIDPRKEALSIVCADISSASEYARIDNRSFRYLRQYLPGPFTFILPTSTSLPKVFKGRKEVGIRIPDNPVALTLTAELGNPILSTTAIAHDEDFLTPLSDPDSVVLASSPVISLLIDSGDTPGVESTIVSLIDSANPEIIRQGAGIFEDI